MTPEYYEKWYWRLREYIGEDAYIDLAEIYFFEDEEEE